jgi:hypothetical protein
MRSTPKWMSCCESTTGLATSLLTEISESLRRSNASALVSPAKLNLLVAYFATDARVIS